ncbi:DUF6249 domain-containing protein [Mariniphaga sediminis]|uniref:DUF6249 domain-containing protein n=1 Tax=Mariniphaga sediminis TaxID=1628158 RepID=UPI003565E88C
MEDVAPLILMTIVCLAFFAAIFLGWYFYIQARNKERMSLIESGKDVSEIYQKREIKFKFPWLKLGIIFTGFSLGWLVALTYNSTLVIMGVIFLFTAVSIIVAYFVDKPKN